MEKCESFKLKISIKGIFEFVFTRKIAQSPEFPLELTRFHKAEQSYSKPTLGLSKQFLSRQCSLVENFSTLNQFDIRKINQSLELIKTSSNEMRQRKAAAINSVKRNKIIQLIVSIRVITKTPSQLVLLGKLEEPHCQRRFLVEVLS